MPITALEFKRGRLRNLQAGLAPRVTSVTNDCVTLGFRKEFPALKPSQDSMKRGKSKGNGTKGEKF